MARGRSARDGHATSEDGAHSAAERLVFFSDAVVAIALTLLAIELPVPGGSTRQEFLHALHEGIPEYLAFGISFLVITLLWSGHHRLYRYLTDAPPALVRWNAVWLLAIVAVPFVTKVLTGGEGAGSAFPFRFGLYALVQVIAGLATTMSLRVMERERLLDDDAPPDLVPHSRRRTAAFILPFAVSIPLAFLIGQVAYGVWIVGPRLVAVALRLVDRRRGTA